jgi:hypothetical protein
MKTFYIRYRTVLPSGVPKFHAERRSGRNRDDVFTAIMDEYSDQDIFVEKIHQEQGQMHKSLTKHWRKILPMILLSAIILVTLLPNLL